ncbi:unnamed protein product, partial [Ostreobium quekettii]
MPGKEPLKKKAIEDQVLVFAPDDRNRARKLYQVTVDADLAGRGWIHQFVHPMFAFNSRKSETTLVAKAYFDKILDEWNRVFNPEEHLSILPERTLNDSVQRLFGEVVKRTPSTINLIYTGVGNGLHLLTEDERLFITPFFEVAKTWLASQPYLLYSHAQYTNYLQNALMDPLLRLFYTVCTIAALKREWKEGEAPKPTILSEEEQLEAVRVNEQEPQETTMPTSIGEGHEGAVERERVAQTDE